MQENKQKLMDLFYSQEWDAVIPNHLSSVSPFLSEQTFHIFAEYAYANAFIKNDKNLDFWRKIYLDIQKYYNLNSSIETFNSLIQSIQAHGFDSNYPIPVDTNYHIIDGSHRLSVSMALTQTNQLFFNIGCHYIDAINQIFDYPNWHICNSVICKKQNRDKSGQINVLLNDCVPLNISFNFQAECFPEIFESSIFIQTHTNTIILTRNGLKVIKGFKIKEYYDAQTPIYEEFCKNIETDKNSHLCTLEEEIVNLQIIENIYDNINYIGE